MIRKGLIILVVIILSVIGTGYAQNDPLFSQFYANKLYLNPAFAGSYICPRVLVNYRNHMPLITGSYAPYTTYSASFDWFEESMTGGLGFMVSSDNQANVYVDNAISAIYSYRLPINPNFSINAGFQASYLMRSVLAENLIFGDQIDEVNGFVNSSSAESISTEGANTPDFSIGVLGYNNSHFFGVAVHHISTPTFGNSRLNRKITVHAGTVFDINGQSERGRRMRRRITDPTINPSLIFKSQGAAQILSYGLYVNKYPFVLGTWYRQGLDFSSDAFIFVLGLKRSVYRIGYSFDLKLNSIGMNNGLAHEVSCAVNLPCRPQKKKVRAINCPTF